MKPDYRFLPKRTDANQAEIMSDFRKLGCMVHSLHTVGDGMFDLIVSVDFLNVLVEVKDGDKPPSARKYTPDQQKFNFAWTGLRAVVTGQFEVVQLVKSMRLLVETFHATAKANGLEIAVTGCNEAQYRPSLY
jgi:hypothetical protein